MTDREFTWMVREEDMMPLEYIEIGPVPCNESCQQVGTPSYDPCLAHDECTRFIGVIREVLGDEPVGARLSVKSFPHDFGSYYEVVCYYDDNIESSVDYAFRCERHAPENWDSTAKPKVGILAQMVLDNPQRRILQCR